MQSNKILIENKLINSIIFGSPRQRRQKLDGKKASVLFFSL